MLKTTEADVIAYYILFYWLMLLPIFLWADVITTCYSIRRLLLMTDVIAMYMLVDVKTTEADVIAYYILFLLLADVIANIFVGRCYNHMLQHKKMADVIARWHME